MKTLSILAIVLLSTHAFAINAGSMKFNVYKLAVSTSAACTSPVVIFENAAGVEQDMVAGPTFGAGRVTAGTYPCVMIELSKIIKTSAATTSGNCTAGFEFSDVICNDTQFSQLINGTSVACSGGITNNQHVTLFMTTISAGSSGNNALLPPATASDTTRAIRLTAPFVVSASRAGVLSVNATNFLSSGGGTCNTSAPTFTFL
jgi:hypothetical protein